MLLLCRFRATMPFVFAGASPMCNNQQTWNTKLQIMLYLYHLQQFLILPADERKNGAGELKIMFAEIIQTLHVSIIFGGWREEKWFKGKYD
jgi:hypothetical protein